MTLYRKLGQKKGSGCSFTRLVNFDPMQEIGSISHTTCKTDICLNTKLHHYSQCLNVRVHIQLSHRHACDAINEYLLISCYMPGKANKAAYLASFLGSYPAIWLDINQTKAGELGEKLCQLE